MGKILKIIGGIAVILIVVAIIVGDEDSDTSNKSTEVTKTYKISDTVETKYFNIVVKGVDTPRKLCEYCDPIESDNQFIRILLEVENTDTEGRSFGDGVLYGNLNSKEYTFDTNEAIFEEGYFTFESINPLVTVTGWVVFKVSDKFNISSMEYELPRTSTRVKLVQ